MKRCPYYEEEFFMGVVAEVFCINPMIQDKYGGYKCPFGDEYDCDIPIHVRNLVI